MKHFFAGALAVLILLSIVAWVIQPRRAAEGKIPLVWVSDDNPARREQIELFNVLLHACDVADWPALCRELCQRGTTGNACPARRVWELLPSSARAMVRAAAQGESLDDVRTQRILSALNDVLRRRDFFRREDFQQVALPPDVEKLLKRDREALSEMEARDLNGRLLELAYPGQVKRTLHVELDPSNTGMAKVIVQCIGGVGPDIFDCYNAFQLSAYVRSGIAWDVTDHFADAGIDVHEDCWEAGWPLMVFEGRVYGFLNNASVSAVWLNKDIFDRYDDIEYPKVDPTTGWTWDEFLPLAKKLTVRDTGGRIKHFGFMLDWWTWNHFVVQWGGRVYTPDGTRCVLDSPETIAAIQFMHDLIYKHGVAPDPVEEAAMRSQGGWGSGTISFFGSGKAAMALGGRWWLCTLRDYEGLRLGAVESPHGPHRRFWAYGRTSLINRNGPRREHALAFLKYLAGREFSELINHQADALAPVIRHCYTDRYLHDPEFPAEDFNAMWRDVMRFGRPSEISPFVNGNVASRIFNKQLDLVKSDQKPAAAAMRDAARLINAEIQDTLERDPSLRERYDALTARQQAE